MSSPRRLRAVSATVVVAVAALTLGACGSGDDRASAKPDLTFTPLPSSSPSTTPTPTPSESLLPTEPGPLSASAPRVGTCRDYDASKVPPRSNPAKNVPCTSRHTAETFAVAEIPESEGPVAKFTDAQMQGFGQKYCSNATLAEWIGSTPKELSLTRIASAFFVPTAAEAAKGERWIRCEFIVQDSGALVPFTSSSKGLLKRVPASSYAACVSPRSNETIETQRCVAGSGQVVLVGREPLVLSLGVVSGSPQEQAAATKACAPVIKREAVSDNVRSIALAADGDPNVDLADRVALCFLTYEAWKGGSGGGSTV